MTIRFNRHSPRGRVIHPGLVETEVARLLILSRPASHPNHPTKKER
jgi:hypothetical protein